MHLVMLLDTKCGLLPLFFLWCDTPRPQGVPLKGGGALQGTTGHTHTVTGRTYFFLPYMIHASLSLRKNDGPKNEGEKNR